jgi:hypothetical protein
VNEVYWSSDRDESDENICMQGMHVPLLACLSSSPTAINNKFYNSTWNFVDANLVVKINLLLLGGRA